jgi:AcrR family transcriptional regulator
MVLRPNEKDPRVIRTRQLIQDAFNGLIKEKEFNAITIRDITEKATVNRATFYAHFDDKYTLLESLVLGTFMTFVFKRIESQSKLTSETLRNLILSVCEYYENLSDKCKRRSQPIAPLIEMKIKMQLEQFISTWLAKSVVGSERRVDSVATMISESIYGATYRWNAEGRKTSAAALADEILPFLMAGLMTVVESE